MFNVKLNTSSVKNFKVFSFQIIWLWTYLMKIIPETDHVHLIRYLVLLLSLTVDTSAGGLLVPGSIIDPIRLSHMVN